MSLNNIELTEPMIALLYGDCLIDCNSVKSAEPGQSKSEILILANIPEKSSSAALELITGMMKACKIAADGFEVQKLHKKQIADLQKTDRKNSPAGILVFGETDEIKQAGLDSLHFEQSELHHIPLLAAPSLEKISSDKKTKMEVWESLKSFFGI